MNIKTANRLCDLRKAHNLSQEDLANKLGVSRQAISKWERSESSPDTDNLIQLANLYNITLDELLNGEEANELIIENNESNPIVEEDNSITIEKNGKKVYINGDLIEVSDDDGIRSYSKAEYDKKTRKEKKIQAFLTPSFTLLIVIAYLLIGCFAENGFANFWFLFILIPVVDSIPGCIIKKRVTKFNYPCLATTFFCATGMMLNWWHPGWVIFITIPVFYAIARGIDSLGENKDNHVIDEAYDELHEKKDN